MTTDKLNGIEEDMDQAFYEDPSGFLKSFAAKIKQEVTEELTGAYVREQRSNEYWSNFHQGRPDLQMHMNEAREILARHEAEWVKENITISESYDRLSEALDEELALRDARKQARYGQAVVSRQGKSEVVAADGSRQPTLGQTILDRQAKFMRPDKSYRKGGDK